MTTDEHLHSVGQRFVLSARAEAVLYMPDACATLAVNSVHADTFQVQIAPATTPEAFIQGVTQSRYRPGRFICHCEAIQALDVLRAKDCVIETMYDAALTKGRAQQNINFIRAGQNGVRIYNIYLLDGDIVSDYYPHAFGLRLDRLLRFDVEVGTIESSIGSRELQLTVRYNKISAPDFAQSRFTVDRTNAPEYVEFERELLEIEGVNTRQGNSVARDHLCSLDEKYKRHNATDTGFPTYPQNSFFTKLAEEPTERLGEALRTACSRLYDAPAVIATIRPQLQDRLLSGTELYPYRAVHERDHLQRRLRTALFSLSVMDDDEVQGVLSRLRTAIPRFTLPEGPPQRGQLAALARRSLQTNPALLVTLDRVLEDVEYRALQKGMTIPQ